LLLDLENDYGEYVVEIIVKKSSKIVEILGSQEWALE
jgi:hypothetical protein